MSGEALHAGYRAGTHGWTGRSQGSPPTLPHHVRSDQIGQWSPDRGGFSLSKAAVLRLEAGAALPQVHLTPDVVQGTSTWVSFIDVVGDVRVGSDLLVMQNGKRLASLVPSPPVGSGRGHGAARQSAPLS